MDYIKNKVFDLISEKLKLDFQDKRTKIKVFSMLIVLGLIIILAVSIVKNQNTKNDISITSNSSIKKSPSSITTDIDDANQETKKSKTDKTDNNAKNNEASSVIYVDVCGAVNNPSVVTLSSKARVIDAIEKCGGLREDASIKNLNRAAFLNDGDKVYVPSISEEETGNVPLSAGSSNAGSGNSTSSTSSTSGLININSSDSESLQQISGVGPSTAAKIIDYRNVNGNFSKIEDIMNVSGIGAKTFEKMKNQICV